MLRRIGWAVSPRNPHTLFQHGSLSLWVLSAALLPLVVVVIIAALVALALLCAAAQYPLAFSGRFVTMVASPTRGCTFLGSCDCLCSSRSDDGCVIAGLLTLATLTLALLVSVLMCKFYRECRQAFE